MNAHDRIKEQVFTEIYNKIKRPDGEITKEKLHYYEGWNNGGIQRGLATVFYKKMDIGGYNKTYIDSYHVRVYSDKVHIYSKNNVNQAPDICFSYIEEYNNTNIDNNKHQQTINPTNQKIKTTKMKAKPNKKNDKNDA